MSINDVAKLAGVSTSTVSRVMNNHPRVAPETVRAVQGAMKQLNYTPSDRRPGPKPAQHSRIRSANIAFLVFGTARGRSTPAFEELLHGVSAGASQFNLNLTFANVPDADGIPTRILENQIDGLLLHGATPAPALRGKLQKVPTVWLMGNRRRPDFGDQVMPDSYGVGEISAKYLVGRGHKRVAFMNLDAGHWPFRLAEHAFECAAKDLGADVDLIEQERNSQAGYWPTHSHEEVERLVQSYLKLNPRPTGLLIADDMQTATIQPMLQQMGVKIGPGETEIVSCNNEKPYLLGLNPRPAVIDIRVAAIGQRGVEQLLWRLENRNLSERFVTAIEPFIITHEGKTIGLPDAESESAG